MTKVAKGRRTAWAMRVLKRDDDTGLCNACGEVVHGVEHDARKYDCPACRKPAVYGAYAYIGL